MNVKDNARVCELVEFVGELLRSRCLLVDLVSQSSRKLTRIRQGLLRFRSVVAVQGRAKLAEKRASGIQRLNDFVPKPLLQAEELARCIADLASGMCGPLEQEGAITRQRGFHVAADYAGGLRKKYEFQRFLAFLQPRRCLCHGAARIDWHSVRALIFRRFAVSAFVRTSSVGVCRSEISESESPLLRVFSIGS